MLTAHVADVVLTMAGPPLIDGAVVVDGDRVVAVGPANDVVPATARVRTHRGVLLPGLVNAHAHLEYGPRFADLAGSGLRSTAWITELTRRRRGLTGADWLLEARGSVHALLRTGTTCVADVVTSGPGVRAAALAGLAGISYVEAVGADDLGWPAERARVEKLLDAGGSGPASRATGVSPHSLCTLSSGAFGDVCALARERGLRLHPHLAETIEEAELVLAGTGRTPAEHCDALGGLGPEVHVAYGVHLSASDRALLRERRTAVALCTRSNTVLQAGQAPVAALLEEGSPIALGTDSLASSPDLDLLAEARACRDLALAQGAPPQGLAERLVRVATVGGAAALGLAEGVTASGVPASGVLAVGVRADLAVFDVPVDTDPYAALLEHGPGRCTATLLAGRLVHRRTLR